MIVNTDPRHSEAERIALSTVAEPLDSDPRAWESAHTGGGCMAWMTECDDGAARILICDLGNGLGDAESDAWLVGLHPYAEWLDHWQDEAKTLQEALNLATMAQAARAFALGFRADEEAQEVTLWRSEFPRFKPSDMPAIPASWRDTSWGNDVCPSFKAPGNLQIFVDFADVQEREFEEGKRFSVNVMDVDGVHLGDDCNVFASDDWQSVLGFVRSYVTPAPTPEALARLAEYAARSGGAEIEREMTGELKFYCEAEGIPHMSADELLAELRGDDGGNPVHCSYLAAFGARWETVSRVTDAQNRAKAEASMTPAEELAAVKAELAAQYVKRIGYDPFADCPTISPAEVARTLIEHADENGKAALDCVAEALDTARRNAFPG